MSKVEKITIALTQEMAIKVKAVVEAGEYASTSEVIRDALRDWQDKRVERELALENLGKLWDEGINSGAPIPAEEVYARIQQKLDAYKAKVA